MMNIPAFCEFVLTDSGSFFVCRDEGNGRANTRLCVAPLLFFPSILCIFAFLLLSLLVLETPKAVATVSVTFLCLFFFLCLLGFPVQCASPCSFSLFRYLPLRFCLRFPAPVPSGFSICFVLLWFFLWDCVWEESFWSVLFNWGSVSSPSFSSSTPSLFPVFFSGSWPVRPSLFSGFFLWVLLEFFPSGFRSNPPCFLLWFLAFPLPFIRPESFKNRLLHNRDRGRRHGHDGFDFVADFPASLLNRSSTSRWWTEGF